MIFDARQGGTIASAAVDAANCDCIFQGWRLRGRVRDAATAPRRSRSGGAKPSCESAKDRAVRACGGQEDTDAGRALDDAGGDLDQTKPQRRERCNRERRALRDGIARGEHEPIGGGVQDEPELVGLGVATRGSVGGELSLVLMTLLTIAAREWLQLERARAPIQPSFKFLFLYLPVVRLQATRPFFPNY